MSSTSAEAICATCYIKNRFTSSKKSPFKLWFGQKPDIFHFRIYGCKDYMHVPKQKRKSLHDRSEECILVGYGTGSTYRLITNKTRRIVIARAVKFDEASLGLCDVKNLTSISVESSVSARFECHLNTSMEEQNPEIQTR